MHGGWARMDGDGLGDIRFGVKTGEYFRKHIELPFFNYYLKGKGDWSKTEAIVFETGSNLWRQYESWPPEGAEERNLYLYPNGGLSFAPPTESGGDAHDAYVSDPSRPVPYTAEVRNRQGHLWVVEDQRFAASRPDCSRLRDGTFDGGCHHRRPHRRESPSIFNGNRRGLGGEAHRCLSARCSRPGAESGRRSNGPLPNDAGRGRVPEQVPR